MRILQMVDNTRREIFPHIAQNHKAKFGQFMTPLSVARFMASLFPSSNLQTCRLLDAGAGIGALSCAFLDRWKTGDFNFKTVEATAYEIDDSLQKYLVQHLTSYSQVNVNIIMGDYIEMATAGNLQVQGYTHIILNPPYKKISSNSTYRLALRRVGLEMVNLYSAFVALAVAQASPGGQIIAIIPRSFCNGPYYKLFRDFILEHTAVRHMHLFESRSKAFKDDKVLQENIIIRLERSGRQGPVVVTTSTDDNFIDLVTHEYPFDRIVFPNDPEKFIHVPTSPEKNVIESSETICFTLADLGIKVSTGPVVDFRLKEHLRNMPERDTIPLLYPGHFSRTGITWPIESLKKANALQHNVDTEKLLYPNGFYCVVRRFSSKEEKRRVVANVVEPSVFGDVSVLGFENRLNVFHENKRGLPEAVARGLSAFLNTTAVDEYFRRFNGHTQVNATDLRGLKYPSYETLIEFGEWAMKQKMLTQEKIDVKLGELIK